MPICTKLRLRRILPDRRVLFHGSEGNWDYHRLLMVGVLQKTHCCKDCNLVDGHPVIDHGTVDGYKNFIRTALIPQPVLWPWNMWYMMVIFTEHDMEKEGFVNVARVFGYRS